uniref:Uncharacterized protein n=1 Tax=Nelumbo nucifera TaxID=4432 RepID=A0A822XKK1_NELNU|nr:TPA_asm: hypothetical protein HUJ06_022280 [Nelumbo nucifera]
MYGHMVCTGCNGFIFPLSIPPLLFFCKSSGLMFHLYLQMLVLACLQGVALEILAAMGIIKSNHFWLDVEQIEEALQNVLVCLEMIIFSVFQQYAYPVTPYSGDVASKLLSDKKNE